MSTGRNHKRIPKSSKYKYVSKVICEKGFIRWYCEYKGTLSYETEHDAAKKVDLLLIQEGKSPINVLKKVND